jgi:hypothetical protein
MALMAVHLASSLFTSKVVVIRLIDQNIDKGENNHDCTG